MRRPAPKAAKRQPSRMTLYRRSQRARGLRSRQLWVADPPQSDIEAAVRKIARKERAEIDYVERMADLEGWK